MGLPSTGILTLKQCAEVAAGGAVVGDVTAISRRSSNVLLPILIFWDGISFARSWFSRFSRWSTSSFIGKFLGSTFAVTLFSTQCLGIIVGMISTIPPVEKAVFSGDGHLDRYAFMTLSLAVIILIWSLSELFSILRMYIFYFIAAHSLKKFWLGCLRKFLLPDLVKTMGTSLLHSSPVLFLNVWETVWPKYSRIMASQISFRFLNKMKSVISSLNSELSQDFSLKIVCRLLLWLMNPSTVLLQSLRNLCLYVFSQHLWPELHDIPHRPPWA